MSVQPHSSWASVYDLAYHHSFGDFYTQLTDTTIAVIQERARPPASIIDFGAGTGRLSIPLSQIGYEVTAVDSCQDMLNQLRQKILQEKITTVCSRMEDYSGTRTFDVALCVFTVLLYLLDEDSLVRALRAAHSSLKAGGVLIIDIPREAIFRGYSTSDPMIERNVSVTRKGQTPLFQYREDLVVKQANGETLAFQDEFLIRYWTQSQVMKTLGEAGFVLVKNLSYEFSGAGSAYYLLEAK